MFFLRTFTHTVLDLSVENSTLARWISNPRVLIQCFCVPERRLDTLRPRSVFSVEAEQAGSGNRSLWKRKTLFPDVISPFPQYLFKIQVPVEGTQCTEQHHENEVPYSSLIHGFSYPWSTVTLKQTVLFPTGPPKLSSSLMLHHEVRQSSHVLTRRVSTVQ